MPACLYLMTFITPQILYRNLIEKSRSQGTSIALKELYLSNSIDFTEDPELEENTKSIFSGKLFDSKLFQQNVTDVISVEQKWIYNPWEMLAFGASQALAFIAIYLKQFFA